jgi:hypothetical protein
LVSILFGWLRSAAKLPDCSRISLKKKYGLATQLLIELPIYAYPRALNLQELRIESLELDLHLRLRTSQDQVENRFSKPVELIGTRLKAAGQTFLPWPRPVP